MTEVNRQNHTLDSLKKVMRNPEDDEKLGQVKEPETDDPGIRLLREQRDQRFIEEAEREAEIGMHEVRRRYETPFVNAEGIVRGADGTEFSYPGRRGVECMEERYRIKISPAGLTQRIMSHIGELKTMEGRDVRGQLRNFFPVETMRRSVRHLARKVYLRKNGIYTSTRGKRWANQEALERELKAGERFIEDRLRLVQRLPARNYIGKPTRAYDLEAMRGIVEKDKADCVQTDEAGYYIDEQGVWCLVSTFYLLLSEEQREKISESSILRRARKECRSLPAIHNGRPGTEVFLLEDLNNLSILTSEIKVDGNGIYTDKEGKKWSSRKNWARYFRVSLKAFDDCIRRRFGKLENVPSVKGFGLAKREDPLYLKDAIKEALEEILGAENLIIDGVCTVIDNVHGQAMETIYATVDEIQKITGEAVKKYQIRRQLRKEKIRATDRRMGAEDDVFEINAAVSHFKGQIGDALSQIERTDSNREFNDENGRWMKLSKYLQEHQDIDPKEFQRHLDLAKLRTRRMCSRNQICYLYAERGLDEVEAASMGKS